MRPTDQVGAAAVAYARLGYRVLPLHHPLPPTSLQKQGMHCSCGDPACGAIGKHPLTSHGLKDATSDPVQLARWWRRWPQANIGLVTGELADVLDIDGPPAEQRCAAMPPVTTCAWRGRWPRPAAAGTNMWHQSAAATEPACSSRWTGVAAAAMWSPPSRHASGRRYRWLRPPTATLPRVPPLLRRLLDPARAQAPRLRSAPAARVEPTPLGHPYGQAALAQELAKVAHSPNGRRNHTLYQAGIRLYSLVAGGVLDHTDVEAGLLAAAEACRLLAEEPTQTRRTLASAERTGRTHPRANLPLQQQPSHPAPFRTRIRQTTRRGDRERDG